MSASQNRITSRKEKRKQKTQSAHSNSPIQEKMNFSLRHAEPLTENQRKTFTAYNNDKHLMLLGSAGTGKTFLSLYLGIKEIIDTKEYEKPKKLIIVRSAEPSKNVGFLPGTLEEKMKEYESAYKSIFSELFLRGDAYDYLKKQKLVEFISTSYVRGITLDNSIVIVDECQNLEWNELYALMTRIGKNSRIIFSGDYKQSDLKNNHTKSTKKEDSLKFIDVIINMSFFETIIFTSADILRSDVVKEFIITIEKLGYD
jgi:phosphate starvation-inducible PhoH-like protein